MPLSTIARLRSYRSNLASFAIWMFRAIGYLAILLFALGTGISQFIVLGATPVEAEKFATDQTQNASANVAVNGDFETPVVSRPTGYTAGQSFEGWTVDTGAVELVPEWQAASGRQALDLSQLVRGSLYQDLATEAGKTYSLQFTMAGNPDGGPTLKQAEVWWGDTLLASLSFDITGRSRGNMGWINRQFTVVATTSSTRLRFVGITDGPYGLAIDKVQLTLPCTTWDLARDYARAPLQENPNRDGCGSPNVWHFMRSASLARNAQTYTLLQGYVRNAYNISGLEEWQGPYAWPAPNVSWPAVGINSTGVTQTIGTAIWPPNAIFLHPYSSELVVVGWRSPLTGTVAISGSFSDLQSASSGDGIDWYIDKGYANLAFGSYGEGGAQLFAEGIGGHTLTNVSVNLGDMLYFVVHPRGTFLYDPTRLTVSINVVGLSGGGQFEISGRIMNSGAQPIAGVVVSAGAGGSAITDASGYYTITNVLTGTYTLTPTKPGTSFSPAKITGVSVPPSRTGRNFVATSWGGQPAPFLDLPVPYDGSQKSFAAIVQNWSADGRINSWFDHKYPDYGYNNGTGIWIYSSPLTDTAKSYWADPATKTILCFDKHCYDGHDGVDFTGSQGMIISATAAGKVVTIKTGCVVGVRGCGGGFGNFVVISHTVPNDNGYFTLYGHLDKVSVVTDTQVTTGQQIGTMGNTGRSGGPHLHFGVYRDNGNGIWNGSGVDRPVDPYGWQVSQPDPYVAYQQGPASYWLWKYRLTTQATITGQAVTLTGATQDFAASIPASRFSGQVTLELAPGPVAGASGQLRQAGRSFWLRILEWLNGDQQAQADVLETPLATAEPITLSVTYTDAQVRHLDTTQLALYWWNEAAAVWQPLPSTVDPQNRAITATTQTVGDFSPQAPLLCPADAFEPDDDFYRASQLSASPAQHVFDIADDEDWFALEAVAGSRYIISTANLAAGVDTVLEIMDWDGQTVLATDDNGGGGQASRLEWQAPQSGTYFVRISRAASSAYGCSASYQVSAFAPYVYLPLIRR